MNEMESLRLPSSDAVCDSERDTHERWRSSAPLELAVGWLLNSGILISKKDHQNYGAVYSHYRGVRDRFELVYAEATGYMVSLLKLLYSRAPTPTLIEIARASADWLAEWAARNNGVIAMGLSDDVMIRKAYAFDNGICCKGLLDVYELTGDERYLRCAGRIADWLVRDALNEDGSIKPVFDFETGRFVENRRIWYEVSGSFHAKIAMPLLQLSVIRSDERLEEAAMRICEWALRQQQPDGNFPANRLMKATFLHFHCYTVEALLYAYAIRPLPRFATALDNAASWILGIQKPDGAVPRWYDGRVTERASDAQAQVVRVLALMNLLKRRDEFDEGAKRALNCLLQLQGVDQNERMRGGFFEGSVRKYRVFVRRTLNMTSWATMFAVHALALVEERGPSNFFSAARFLF